MIERGRLVRLGLPLLAIIGGAVAVVAVTTGRPESPLVRPLGDPPRQPETSSPASFIGATGVIEAASENVAIGTNVGGIVTRVAVRPGETVERGQLLFTVDSREAQAALRVRQADAVSAERQIASLAAAVREAEVDLADRITQAQRAASADVPGAVSAEEVASRRYAAEAAAARLARARADLARQRSDAERARAQVDEARTSLALLRVKAPIAGQVLRVNVRPGEFAPAGQASDALVVLGQVRPLHVRVDVDEADIPRVEAGASATIRLRGAAARPLQASFVRIEPLVVPKSQLSGANTELVDTRVLQLIYAVDPGTLPMFPGQQVDVFLPAAQAATATAR